MLPGWSSETKNPREAAALERAPLLGDTDSPERTQPLSLLLLLPVLLLMPLRRRPLKIPLGRPWLPPVSSRREKITTHAQNHPFRNRRRRRQEKQKRWRTQ